MVCKLLFFEYKDDERSFFINNDLVNFDIKFFPNAINDVSIDNLSQNELNETVMLSVNESSVLTPYVISRFKNLRLISVRSCDYNNIDLVYCFNNNIALINVEKSKDKNPDEVLKESFAGMANFLCGGKEYRVV